MAILYPTSLVNLVVEVGTRHSHQTLLHNCTNEIVYLFRRFHTLLIVMNFTFLSTIFNQTMRYFVWIWKISWTDSYKGCNIDDLLVAGCDRPGHYKQPHRPPSKVYRNLWWASSFHKYEGLTHLHGQNDHHCIDDTFRCIFVNGKFCTLIKMSLKCVAKGPTDNNPALV